MYNKKDNLMSFIQKNGSSYISITYANKDIFTKKNSKQIRATTTHEVGHALSLSHSTGDDDIMKQGSKDYTKLSDTDKDFLKQKWGD